MNQITIIKNFCSHKPLSNNLFKFINKKNRNFFYIAAKISLKNPNITNHQKEIANFIIKVMKPSIITLLPKDIRKRILIPMLKKPCITLNQRFWYLLKSSLETLEEPMLMDNLILYYNKTNMCYTFYLIPFSTYGGGFNPYIRRKYINSIKFHLIDHIKAFILSLHKIKTDINIQILDGFKYIPKQKLFILNTGQKVKINHVILAYKVTISNMRRF